MKEILFIDGVFESSEDYSDRKMDLIQSLHKINTSSNSDEDFSYLIENVFDEWIDTVDMDYVLQVGRLIPKIYSEISVYVDKYTSTFWFESMWIMEQALFVLWYAEWKVFETPKEILLNELVELSKRYADDGSAKLLNGIMHKIFAEVV